MERNKFKGGGYIIQIENNKKRLTYEMFEAKLYETLKEEFNNLEEIINKYKDKNEDIVIII